MHSLKELQGIFFLKKNQGIRLLHITTHTIERNNNHRAKVECQQPCYEPKWNQQGNHYGGTWRTKSNAWRYQSSTATCRQSNQNQDQGGREIVGPYVHISLGWMDDCAWYQLTMLLRRSYYMSSTHVFRMKHVSRGVECNAPRRG